MKTIEVSDEDYKILMELSAELQKQDNHCQAFPYFWEPMSKHREVNIHDEGEEIVIYDYDDSESYTLEEYAERQDDELWKDFLIEEELIGEESSYDNIIAYNSEKHENDWYNFLKYLSLIHDKHNTFEIFTEDWVDKSEHNPSIFLSDVQNFIDCNRHHLGKEPHTYARTIWRMPKMIKLVECIYRLNKNVKEDEINHEAKRFVIKYRKDIK